MVVCFWAVSCVKEEADKPTLELSSMEVLTFPKAASENSITITTNQDYWTALANAEWIECVQTDNLLTVKVLENTTTEKRKARINVLSGGIGKSLEVVQEATDVLIITTPDKFESNQWGGNYQLGIDANIKEWGFSIEYLTAEKDWVKLKPKKYKNEIDISIAQNTAREARMAKIVLSGPDRKGVKEVTMEQSGIMYHILPYMGFGEDQAAVRSFEITRRSGFASGAGNNELAFKTVSPAFDKIVYRFFPEDGTYTESYVYAQNKDFFKNEMEDVVKFLKDNGFEEKGKNIFMNEKLNVKATIKPDGSEPHVYYKYIPKQPEAMPTFEAIPYGFTEFGVATRKDVDDYEAKNNGVFNEVKSNLNGMFLFYDVKETPNLWVRSYYIAKKNGVITTLNQTVQYYTKQSLVFYEMKGELYVTHEFKALMEKEGFVYENSSSGYFRFLNVSKKLRIAVRWGTYGGVDGKVLGFHFSPVN